MISLILLNFLIVFNVPESKSDDMVPINAIVSQTVETTSSVDNYRVSEGNSGAKTISDLPKSIQVELKRLFSKTNKNHEIKKK